MEYFFALVIISTLAGMAVIFVRRENGQLKKEISKADLEASKFEIEEIK